MVSGRRPTAGTLRPLPPVSSKAKDYTDRPEEVVDELDELRTRGIAKVLNKHFTTTTRKLAIEKAEADSALADLERRRAQTKAFVPSKGGDLNPYDQLYVQLQQKRAECRRKERETMMLYQRYVMKYGKSAKAAPLVSAASSSAAVKDTQDGVKDDKVALGTLDENSEITFSKFYEEQQRDQEKEAKRKEENAKSTQHFVSALNKFMTVSEDDEDNQANDVHKIQNEESPSPVQINNKPDPFMSAVSKFTKGEEGQSAEDKNSLILTKEDEDIVIEPNTVPLNSTKSASENGVSAVVTPEIKRTPSKDQPVVEASDSVAEDESMLSQVQNHIKEEPSLQKPLENGHAVIPQVKAVNLRVTPDVVPEAAAITLSPSSPLTPKSNKVVSVDVNPYFHTTTIEGFDFDDRSIISELTSANSAVTRQVLDEVETEMEDFIKFEMEAIRKMLDSEEDASTVDFSVKSETSSLMLGDQSVQVAMKAEAMAREMQKILDDFAKEDAASVEGTKSIINESTHSSERRNESAEPTSVYPYKFEPAIPGEEWYVHFDDNYQKEYYVEKNSNRTQWDYPQKMSSPHKEHAAVSSDDFLSDMVSVASSRRSMSRRSSRRKLYRKQRKRRRARRLMMSSMALLCVLVAVIYWRLNHSGESVIAALIVSIQSANFKGLMTSIVDQIEYSFTDRKEREELILQQQEALAKIEKERREREHAEQKAYEEAQRILKEVKQKAAEEDEAAPRLSSNSNEQQLENPIEPLAENGSELECQTRDRHWGCNIPFAYLHPHCWRLAKTNPAFGIKNENHLTFLQ